MCSAELTHAAVTSGTHRRLLEHQAQPNCGGAAGAAWGPSAKEAPRHSKQLPPYASQPAEVRRASAERHRRTCVVAAAPSNTSGRLRIPCPCGESAIDNINRGFVTTGTASTWLTSVAISGSGALKAAAAAPCAGRAPWCFSPRCTVPGLYNTADPIGARSSVAIASTPAPPNSVLAVHSSCDPKHAHMCSG